MAGSARDASFGDRTGVRVVVAGDEGTGKSSLILSVATESFPENVPRVVPPTYLPDEFYPDRVPLTIIDTSSSLESKSKLVAECQAADAIVLTYACDRPSTLDRLSTYWLPELRRLEVKAAVILAGCKLDLRDEQVSLEQMMSPIMQRFREIETCIECSALTQTQVLEVFYYAQKAVLHPTAPLFDQQTRTMKPRCVRALERIFSLCDHDRDGALSDAELNDFQVRCFNAPLLPTEIVGVKKVVQEKIPEGVNEHGLTLAGFIFLHALFIEKGRLETTWTVLRKFGYNNDIELRDDLLPSAVKRAPDEQRLINPDPDMSTGGDLLRIDPLELQFPFEIKKQLSFSFQLANSSDDCVAFKVKATNPKKYWVKPNAGIVLPCSTCNVVVTMKAQMEAPPELQCKDKFLVQSVLVSNDTTVKDITPEMFTKESGNTVEEVKLLVTYVAPPQPPSPVLEEFEEVLSPRASVLDNGNAAPSDFVMVSRASAKLREESLEMNYDPSSTSKKKSKFLCSFGGKILPRPRDQKLRYVGGETRIIRISQHSSWQDLAQEMMAMYGQSHAIKYQLPEVGENFHCLLSVSCDEDLEDMMEYGVLDGGGSQKLIRVFLFPLGDDGDGLDLTFEGDSRSQYLSAINGIDLGVQHNSASRGFHSEPSNPRAQAELLNHLSKAEAANRLHHESEKSWAPRTQRSSPAALEDGLVEFDKDIEFSNSVAKSNKSKPGSTHQESKEAKIPDQPLHSHESLSNPEVEDPSPEVEESLGETISEYAESATEEAGGLIIDTPVGKAELSNMQVMDNKDLVELKKLGSGGFGTVYHGKWRGTDVAIKRINRSCFTGQPYEHDRLILDTFREAGILANLHHPNIVSFYGFAPDELGKTLAIVMEFVIDGSLKNILHRGDNYLDHRKRLIIAMGAASGMEYLHLRKIVHFDLKCDNLLVDLKDPSRPICKVTDFGLSKVKQDTLVSGGVRGTLPWMAPELLRGDRSKVSEKVDVFSFGIVMWEILTGEVPYAGMLDGQIIGGIYSNTLRPPVPASCDPTWRRLMEECWASDPQRRPPFSRIAGRLHSMLVTGHAEAGK